MSKKFIFLILLVVVIIILGILFYVYPRTKIRKPVKTMGRIVKTETTVPETMRKNNSKFALIEIDVNGKSFLSDKMIQVSMLNEVGDTVEVIYDRENPSNMASAKIIFY